MKKPIFLSVFFIILLYGCSKNESDNCDTISGVYTGTMSGYPLKGTLKLIINLDQEDISSLTGTWSAENGLSGEINRLDVTCSTGNFEYDYGLSLTGPFNIICPDNNPGSPGCYASGATLGMFKGKITSSGGNGYWTANSGAADYLGVTGSGTWVVTKD